MAAGDLRRAWAALIAIFVGGFAIMAFCGTHIYRQAPPIPTFRERGTGEVIFSHEDILSGQEVWQSIGGQQVGSIWGHGALQAPDWTADWMHREALANRAVASHLHHHQHVAAARNNTHEPDANEAWLSRDRAKAVLAVKDYYVALFTGATTSPDFPDLVWLRAAYAMKDVSLLDHRKAELLAAFVFWSAWAASTERPGLPITYTSNWPSEPLVGNSPAADVMVWSMTSVALLIGGIGIVGWARASSANDALAPPAEDPLKGLVVTPSMRSLRKWIWVVFALGVLQVVWGVYVAHVSVTPDPASKLALPSWLMQNLTYTVARTWHVQTSLFFTVGGFLAAGLFLAPMIGGRTEDPPYQKLFVDILFVCVLLIVVGSFAGQLAAVHQLFESLRLSQWFGHQGYEYLDLGRFWQSFLMAGLVIWLALVARAIWPALVKRAGDGTSHGLWHLTLIITAAVTLVGTFYAAGFMFSARTHLSIMEYWRFYIVHMWVEGFFEVFATVIIAFLFSKLKLIDPEVAAGAVLFSSCVFLFGGIPGMFHHNYWAGTPTMIMAIGAVFSALEVVPLALIGYDVSGYMDVAGESEKPSGRWLRKYQPLVDCFVSVAFWNFVGAGILGFIINPPIALYYLQGTYLVQAHSHGALWGVYGVLSLAMCLLVLRLQDLEARWDSKTVGWGIWCLNVGMFLQIFLSLVPIGLYQFWASVKHGYWFARSHHFHQDPTVQWLKLARSFGDAIFGLGMVLMCVFVVRLGRLRPKGQAPEARGPMAAALLSQE